MSPINEYILNPCDKIIDLKKLIVKDVYNNVGYVDVDFLMERTKRTFGKFNLESGVMARSLDRRTLDDFGLKDDTINIKVVYTSEDIHTLYPVSLKIPSISTGTKYIPPKPSKPIAPLEPRKPSNPIKMSKTSKTSKSVKSTKTSNNLKPTKSVNGIINTAFALSDSEFPTLN